MSEGSSVLGGRCLGLSGHLTPQPVCLVNVKLHLRDGRTDGQKPEIEFGAF